MTKLKNKVDFVAVLAVTNANPNGDPLFGNRPRTDYAGIGEISDVCIKRKLRNRIQDVKTNDEGIPENRYEIFVQSDDHKRTDTFKSMKSRTDAFRKKKEDPEEFTKRAFEKWFDVRAFGQTFAFGGEDSISEGVRGPVTIHMARSVSPVEIVSMQITRCINGAETKDGKRANDTMGMKHFVRFGLYLLKGSINVQLAEKTGFSYEDAQVVKECLRTLFENDASSARPEGSMEVVKLYWFEHNSAAGQYSSAKVHRSVKVTQKDPMDMPSSVDDYKITLQELPGLTPEIIDGL